MRSKAEAYCRFALIAAKPPAREGATMPAEAPDSVSSTLETAISSLESPKVGVLDQELPREKG